MDYLLQNKADATIVTSDNWVPCVCVCVCVCARVRACVRACVRVRARVHAFIFPPFRAYHSAGTRDEPRCRHVWLCAAGSARSEYQRRRCVPLTRASALRACPPYSEPGARRRARRVRKVPALSEASRCRHDTTNRERQHSIALCRAV